MSPKLKRPALLPELSLKSMQTLQAGPYDMVPDKTFRTAMLHVVALLNREHRSETGTLYHLMPMSMQKTVIGYGVPDGVIADFLLVMQEIGLIRCYARGTHSKWEVCDESYAEAFLTPLALDKAIANVQERHRRTTELRRAKENLQRMNAYADELEAQGPVSNLAPVSVGVEPVIAQATEPTDNEVMLLAALEQATEKLGQQAVEITTLNAELAKKAAALSLDERVKAAMAKLQSK